MNYDERCRQLKDEVENQTENNQVPYMKKTTEENYPGLTLPWGSHCPLCGTLLDSDAQSDLFYNAIRADDKDIMACPGCGLELKLSGWAAIVPANERLANGRLADVAVAVKKADEALPGGGICPVCSHRNDVDGYISGDSKTWDGYGATLDFKGGSSESRDYIPGSIINTEKEKIKALVDAHWNYKQKDLTIVADRTRVYTFDEVMEIRKWDYTSSAVHFYKHGSDAAMLKKK